MKYFVYGNSNAGATGGRQRMIALLYNLKFYENRLQQADYFSEVVNALDDFEDLSATN